MGDDESLYEEIVSVFLDDSPKVLEQFCKAIAIGDFKAAGIAVHSLKSSAGAVGARSLQQLAASIEKAINAGESESAIAATRSLQDELAYTHLALSSQENSLKNRESFEALEDQHASQKGPLKGRDILLVEDDHTSRIAISRLLKLLGAEERNLRIVSSYHEALHEIRNSTHDLLIVDFFLEAGKSGLDVLHEVQNAGLQAPVIMLTGNEEEGTDLKVLQAGAADYIAKSELSLRLLERSIMYSLQRARRQFELLRIDQLERERNSLKDSIRGLEQVLGVVGHELRTPIAGIRMMLEAIASNEEMEKDQVGKYLNLTIAEVVRLSSLVNDLLEVTKLNSGLTKWQWGEVHFESVVQEALRATQALIAEKGLKLEVLIEPTNLTIHGDSSAIARAIQNLVTNSLKHTDQGSISIRVSERLVDGEGFVALTVTDTGRGIPPEKLVRLGQAFVLNAGVIGPNFVQGSGLGLAIVKGIIEAHGGELKFESTVGKGTTATALMKIDLDSPV